jgi:hypothetical protein
VVGPLRLVLAVAVTLSPLFSEVLCTGRVTDANGAPLTAARIVLRSATSSQQAFSGPAGAFEFNANTPGAYWLTVEREGYYQLKDRPIQLKEGSNEATLVLNPVRELFDSVNVPASPPGIDFDKAGSEKILTGAEILEIPFPTTHSLTNAMRLLPNAIQDAGGGIHINGGTQEQVLYTLDGFNLNDPLTGRLESRLSVEAVQLLEVSSGAIPAEFGKGSAATLAVKTASGDDKLRYSGTNFIPGVGVRKGVAIQDWTPRLGLSGPIRKGRAWFSDSADVQYIKNLIEQLPAGQDRTASWRLSNLLRGQVNLTPSNILFAGFLLNYYFAPLSGLGVLNPPSTTIDQRSRQWFFDIKDQIYFHRGALLEIGFASNQTFGREIPQGHGLYILTPDGNQGNFYVDSLRKGARDQLLGNLFLPSIRWKGSHQVKLGVDLDRLGYWQNIRRTGFVNYHLDGTPVSRVVFAGNGLLNRSNYEASSYVQDTWTLKPKLLVEAGLRQDWDAILGTMTVAPRVATAWAPPGLQNTKLSAGYAVIREATNLRLFVRPLDQYTLTTYFLPDGSESGPSATIFTNDNRKLLTPTYQVMNLGLDQRLPGGVYARVDFLRRRGESGLNYSSVTGINRRLLADRAAALGATTFDGLYVLGNGRRDVFDSVGLTLRQEFRGQYEWMASYTRSRSFSNSVADLSVDSPTQITSNVGRMPWDSPNRFMGWGIFPLPRKDWALPFMVEYHDGFPFSVHDDSGRLKGDINSFRLPAFLELNTHLEHRFTFHKQRWAGRAGFNNVINHKNPNVVNANSDSRNFMHFYGGQGRTLNFRIRWLGKAEAP